MSMEKTFRVGGMHCKSCKMLLEDVLGEVAGIEKASADEVKGLVKLRLSGAEAVLLAKKAIESQGYKVLG